MKTSAMMRCPKCQKTSELDNLHLLDRSFKREWVGLTDEEIQQGYETTGHYQTLRPQDKFAVFALAKAIEAKLKEKNSA